MINSGSSSNNTNCVKNALILIIHSEGTSILDNPKKTRALLLDYCTGNNKREIVLLEQLLNEQIHKDLVRQKETVPYPILSVNLAQKVLGNHPFDETLTRWGIDTLAIALGVLQSAPRSQQKPVVQPAKQIRNVTSPIHVKTKDMTKIYNVNFYSEPPGAEIAINRIVQGFSPLSIPMSEGTYCVSGSLPDYENWIRDISVPYELFVRIELKKKKKVKPKRSMTPYFNRLPKAPTPENQGILGRIKDTFK